MAMCLQAFSGIFPLERAPGVKIPMPKTQQCVLEAKVEKGFSDIQNSN